MISSINKRYFAVVKDAEINGRIRWTKRWTKGEQTGRTERPMKSSPEAESSNQSSGYYLEKHNRKIPGSNYSQLNLITQSIQSVQLP